MNETYDTDNTDYNPQNEETNRTPLPSNPACSNDNEQSSSIPARMSRETFRKIIKELVFFYLDHPLLAIWRFRDTVLIILTIATACFQAFPATLFFLVLFIINRLISLIVAMVQATAMLPSAVRGVRSFRQNWAKMRETLKKAPAIRRLHDFNYSLFISTILPILILITGGVALSVYSESYIKTRTPVILKELKEKEGNNEKVGLYRYNIKATEYNAERIANEEFEKIAAIPALSLAGLMMLWYLIILPAQLWFRKGTPTTNRYGELPQECQFDLATIAALKAQSYNSIFSIRASISFIREHKKHFSIRSIISYIKKYCSISYISACFKKYKHCFTVSYISDLVKQHKKESLIIGGAIAFMILPTIVTFISSSDLRARETLRERGISLSDTNVVKKAIEHNDIKLLKLLLKAKADSIFSYQEQVNVQHLITAARLGNEDCLELLLEYKANINDEGPGESYDDRETPLTVAVKKQHTSCIELLLDAGADINKGVGYAKEPPLILAVKHNSPKCVKLLLDAGADIYTENYFQETALLAAAENGFTECIELLLDAGADINKTNLYDSTPLLAAIKNGQADCVKFLIKAGADVNKADSMGETPIFKAASRGQLNCMNILIDAGADVNKANIRGRTPLSEAIRTNGRNSDVARRLMNITQK